MYTELNNILKLYELLIEASNKYICNVWSKLFV